MASQQTQAGDRTTNFAMACNLLSQLVKENAFVPKGKMEHFRAPVTMNLLPKIAEFDDETEDESKGNTLELFPQHPIFVQEDKLRTLETTRKQESSQLTIFYGGKVLVFDKFSADKAENLMQFATKTASSSNNFAYSQQPSFPDLPLTRKASLQRFFDTRKDRIKARGPYSVFASPRKATPAKSEESATWLGLVPKESKDMSLNLSSDCSK